MTTRYARSESPHEEIHFLAQERLGACFSTALYEGLSFSYEPVFRGQELGLHAAVLLERREFPSIAQLLDEEA